MKIRTLIVDDEQPAREGIRLRLQNHEGFEIIGECSSGRHALQSIRENQPDLVFLDIQMPVMNGFDILQQIDPAHMPIIIFVTAYDRYALEAFKVHALDYLLKPIDDERFQEALKRTREQIRYQGSQKIDARLSQLLLYLDRDKQNQSLPQPQTDPVVRSNRIAVKSRGQIIFFKTNEIEWIESADDYVYLHANGEKHLSRDTLVRLERELPTDKFIRVHRSAIINFDFLRELQLNDRGEYQVILTGGKRINCSRTYRENLEKILNNCI